VTLKLASGTVCTGGPNRSTCLIKLTNLAGPFGSYFAVACEYSALYVRADAKVWELAPAAAAAQSNGAQQVAQPSLAPQTTAIAAAVTPPALNSSQKSSQISQWSTLLKLTGNKKHKHKGSKKAKVKTSKHQKSTKVDSPSNENVVVSKYDDPASKLPIDVLLSSTEV
jgi:hypothetical protein